MSLSKERRGQIADDIIQEIGSPSFSGFLDLASLARHYGVTGQSVARLLTKLRGENRITAETSGRSYKYSLPREEVEFDFPTDGLKEDEVFRKNIAAFISSAPETPRRNFAYAFTEILNNAVEHSKSPAVTVCAAKTEAFIEFSIRDKGVGIFAKIAAALKLEDTSHAILELMKGKFTTNPRNHTGEGIFFSSKAGDLFTIHSGNIVFTVSAFMRGTNEEYAFSSAAPPLDGTSVSFRVWFGHVETLAEVFSRFAPEDSFVKTVVPVKLLEQDSVMPIVSRSQARRLLARFEKFRAAELDFEGVSEIGQGFADEIFRVFRNEYPEIEITPVNCGSAISAMIKRVTAAPR
ncbi:MAG: DUF4325 domain-containing protein [Clostridiales bacterium]|jgi:anti-sigma regulatory factor (Ser/Thr protein kinase)|nr:DUF4325 domain-containing protein [Clostridiales bacterium]